MLGRAGYWAGVALAFLASASASAATKYWVGSDATSPTLASVAANWADDASGTAATAAPADGDDIVLDALAGSRPLTWDLDVCVHSWTQSSDYTGTVTFYTGRAENAATHGVTSSDAKTKELRITGSVVLEAGAWTTPEQPSLTASDAAWTEGNGVYRLVARIGGTLTVAAAASIDVTAKGFAMNEGPGIGSHGGVGAGQYGDSCDWYGHEFSHSDTYGSIKKPVTIGSGSDVGAGGGGIELEVTGAATINGAILAKGAGSGYEDDSGSYCCGGGGGGIWIKAASLTGAGTISASHGYVMFGGGGGGRVSVVLTGEGSTFANWTGTVAASDNFADWDFYYYNYNTPGTIYLEEAGLGGVGDLIVKDGCTYDDCWTITENGISCVAIPTNNVEDAHFRDVVLTNGYMLAIYTGAVLRVDRNLAADSREMDDWGEYYTYQTSIIWFYGGELDMRQTSSIPNCALKGYAPGSAVRVNDGAGTFRVLTSSPSSFYYAMSIHGGLCVDEGAVGEWYGELAVHGDVSLGTGSYAYFGKRVTVDGDMSVASAVTVYTAGAGGSSPAYYDIGYRLSIAVAGDMMVADGSLFSATGKGYYYRIGPSGRNSDAHKYDGGSHGGLAAHTSGEQGVYGNPAEPTQLGAGGGNAYGGGGVRLVVGKTLTLNGQVAANGGDTSKSGAGAGGSVWITCSNLVGGANAVVSANGGRDLLATTVERRHGGGGRVAVHLTGDGDFSQYLGKFQAHGGFQTTNVVTRQAGAGTVYLKKKDGTSRLILDNGDDATYANRAELPAATHFTEDVTSVVYTDVVVTNRTWLSVAVGGTLQIVGDFTNVSGVTEPMGEELTCGKAAGSIAFVDAARTSYIYGSPVFRTLACETPGKTLCLAADDSSVATIAAGGTLSLCGGAVSPVSLASSRGGARARLVLADGAVADARYARVQDVDSSDGATVYADNSCTLGANVQNWVQMSVVAGENTWTGDSSARWGDAANWSLGRPPIPGDGLVFTTGRNVAALPANVACASARIAAGATLDLAGHELAVSGDVTVLGTLKNTETSSLAFVGVASTAVLKGYRFASVVTLGSVTFADAFAADAFTATAESAAVLTFAAGTLYEFGDVVISGEIEGAAGITLKSGSEGTAWRIKAANPADVRGVTVSDSVVESGGLAIAAKDPCVNAGGNSGWYFNAAETEWVSDSDGNWADAANWSAGVPSASSFVTIGKAVTVRLPENATAACYSLTLSSPLKYVSLNGSGQYVGTIFTNVTGCALHVLGSVEVKGMAAIDPQTTVDGSVYVRDGGTLQHSGGAGWTDVTAPLGLKMKVGGDFVVEAGGTVTAKGKGYGVANANLAVYGSSRSHLVQDYHFGFPATNGILPGDINAYAAYGSIFTPTNIPYSRNSNNGWAGGLIRLDVGRQTRIDGMVTADGADAAGGRWGGQQGGCGGSIWITTAKLRGSGSVSAGAGRPVEENSTIFSGGGRIAVYVNDENTMDGFTGKMSAYTWQAHEATVSVDRPRMCGTVYVQCKGSRSRDGRLIVDNGGYWGLNWNPYWKKTGYGWNEGTLRGGVDLPVRKLNADGVEEYRNIHVDVKGKSRLYITQNVRIEDLTLTDGSEICLNGYTLTVNSWKHYHFRQCNTSGCSIVAKAFNTNEEHYVSQQVGRIVWLHAPPLRLMLR